MSRQHSYQHDGQTGVILSSQGDLSFEKKAPGVQITPLFQYDNGMDSFLKGESDIIFALKEQTKQLAGTTVHELFDSHIYLICDLKTTPFKGQSAYLTFRKIESAKIKYPTDSNDISEEAKDLLNKIFVVTPKKRLGGGDWETLILGRRRTFVMFFSKLLKNGEQSFWLTGSEGCKCRRKRNLWKRGSSVKKESL